MVWDSLGGLARRTVFFGGAALVGGISLLTGCTPLETFDTLVRTDRGAAVAARDVAYGPDARQRFDVYRPEKPGLAPVLVFFHGGSWNSGDKDGYSFAGKTFAAKGFVTVVVSYRLAPAHPFPAFVEDGAAAVAAARRMAGQWGGDPARLYLVGHSAGAHIAALLGVDGRYLKAQGMSRSAIRAIAGISGPYDFYPFTNADAVTAFGAHPRPQETQPVSVAQAGAPPMLLLHGSADTLVLPRNSAALAQRLRALGTPVEEKVYPGVGHIEIFTAITPAFRKTAPTLADVTGYFARRGAGAI